MRKRGIVLVTTAQEWLEINVTLRRYVRYQIDCKMIRMPFLNYAVCIRYIYDGDTMHWDNDANDYIADIMSSKLSINIVSLNNLKLVTLVIIVQLVFNFWSIRKEIAPKCFTASLLTGNNKIRRKARGTNLKPLQKNDFQFICNFKLKVK